LLVIGCSGATRNGLRNTLDLPVSWKVKEDEVMRIGELAERAGISTKAIRYYEQVGILAEPARTPSGYRDYDQAAVGRLAFVRAGQAVGLRLGELRRIIALRDHGEVPCEHVAALLRQRSADLDARISELQQLRHELGRLSEQAQRLDPAHCAPERVCHLIG
jgi:DNA-binding transcriptional MerR regulator